MIRPLLRKKLRMLRAKLLYRLRLLLLLLVMMILGIISQRQERQAQSIKYITAPSSTLPPHQSVTLFLFATGFRLDFSITRYDALAARTVATTLSRHGAAAAATCHLLLNMSRDNIVCNRSALKYFKVETIFTELQSLRAAAVTLPPRATPIPTMSLAEVTRSADLLCNCLQV
jgi:hypothetical protein